MTARIMDDFQVLQRYRVMVLDRDAGQQSSRYRINGTVYDSVPIHSRSGSDTMPRNYIAIELTLGYRRTAQQMDAIVHATSISALPDLLNAAAQNHTAELTVQMNYFENQQAEVLSIVQQVQRAQPGETADPWQVNFYPEGANVGIIEIILKK